jgi:hypothetical protein
MVEAVSHRLAQLQNPDGGWGPRAGVHSVTETTALALLAVDGSSPGVAADHANRAAGWLVTRQEPDGSWPVAKHLPGPSWMTSLAVLALASRDSSRGEALAGARWLARQRARRVSWLARLLHRLERSDESAPEPVSLDYRLSGWPWLPGTFGWVEPTAYALLALKTLRSELQPAQVRERIRDGEALLWDRMCRGGGWNYGNPRIFGQDLWPYPDTTAWALIALQDSRSAELAESLEVLRATAGESGSTMALSLGILALQLHGTEVGDMRTALASRLEPSAPDPDVRSLALASLALDHAAVPFLIPPDA